MRKPSVSPSNDPRQPNEASGDGDWLCSLGGPEDLHQLALCRWEEVPLEGLSEHTCTWPGATSYKIKRLWEECEAHTHTMLGLALLCQSSFLILVNIDSKSDLEDNEGLPSPGRHLQLPFIWMADALLAPCDSSGPIFVTDRRTELEHRGSSAAPRSNELQW